MRTGLELHHKAWGSPLCSGLKLDLRLRMAVAKSTLIAAADIGCSVENLNGADIRYSVAMMQT